MADDVRFMATAGIDGEGNGSNALRYEGAGLGTIQAGAQLVPKKPSARMLAAGARAGDVSVEIAWKVYQAMINESE